MVRIGYGEQRVHSKGGFAIMAAAGNIQIMYGCESCKDASDSQGRGCKCGLMFPILLLLSGMTSCPNYEEDIEKINKSMEMDRLQ